MAAPAPVRHLTTAELADRLHTTAANVREMNSRGTGPTYMRVGKQCLYRLADVEAWEESRLVRAPA